MQEAESDTEKKNSQSGFIMSDLCMINADIQLFDYGFQYSI